MSRFRFVRPAYLTVPANYEYSFYFWTDPALTGRQREKVHVARKIGATDFVRKYPWTPRQIAAAGDKLLPREYGFKNEIWVREPPLAQQKKIVSRPAPIPRSPTPPIRSPSPSVTDVCSLLAGWKPTRNPSRSLDDADPKIEPRSTKSPSITSSSHGESSEDSITSIPPPNSEGIPEPDDRPKFTPDLRFVQGCCGRREFCWTWPQFDVAAKAAYEDAFLLRCINGLGLERFFEGVPTTICEPLFVAIVRARERFCALQTMFGLLGTQEHILYHGRENGFLPDRLYRAIDLFPHLFAPGSAASQDSAATSPTRFRAVKTKQYAPPCRLFRPTTTSGPAANATPAAIETTSSTESLVEERVVEPRAEPTLFGIETTGSGYPLESTAEQLDFDSTGTRCTTETEESEESSVISDTAFLEPEELSDARMEDWSEVPTRQTIDEATPASESEPESTTSTVASYASSIVSTISSTISSLCSAVVDKVKKTLTSL